MGFYKPGMGFNFTESALLILYLRKHIKFI